MRAIAWRLRTGRRPRASAAQDAGGVDSQWRSRLQLLGSVRVRITAAALAVVGVAVLVGSVGLLSVLRSALLDLVDETAMLRAQEMATMVAAGNLDPRLPVPVEADKDDLLVQVVDEKGRVVAASPNALGDPPIGTEPLEDGARSVRTMHGLPIDVDDNFRVLAQAAESPSGPVTIYVATELKPFEETVATVRRTVKVGAGTLLVLMGALTWFLVGRALRRVESIRSQVAEISATALHRRLPEPVVNDEVGRLARTMNAMLERLQVSSERQQRFAADASHELRSPLASARAQLEVAVAHPTSTTVEALASDLLAEHQRMERLVADLLLLTRTEQGRVSPAEEVDIDELVMAELARLRPHARVRFEILQLSGARIRGHPEQLRRVVRNLFENAAHHAEATVAVELRSDGDAVVLVVGDDGPGIPPADRGRVFDRFTRLDDARGRHHGGSGLGLAIAREVIQAHGGKIWVADGAGGGARLLVRLPKADRGPGGKAEKLRYAPRNLNPEPAD